tara:strand:+ start:42982 stop:43620 length:639 start_codon:yes stop_codon:yes gene_type:complete
METQKSICLEEEFLKQFKKDTNKDFIINNETTPRLYILTDYFAQSDVFFESPLLIKSNNTPSFEKGLLIIGDFGTGKTVMLNTMIKVLNRIKMNKIKSYNAQKVVHEYESLVNGSHKKDFYESFSYGQILFDDILTEDIANNYGTKNVFKELLEVRYENNAKTFITCNFDPNNLKDIQKALDQFLLRYGGRVYDRLFEMFNIIEFKGNSLRK